MATVENMDLEQGIDLTELIKKLWSKKKFILLVSLIAAFVGIVVAFSIPKEYKTTVVLTLDSKSSGLNGAGMGTLAAMAGINLPQTGDSDISPDLYPNIVGSTPFILGLFDIEIKDKNNSTPRTLYTYLEKEQKRPWWGYIFGLPSRLLGRMSMSKKEMLSVENTVKPKSDIIDLTFNQSNVMQALKNRIGVIADKKARTITISCVMQSPEISAYMVDTLTSYLQSYIIAYRTHKARQDLVFTEKLYNESRDAYYKAQKNYATYSDENLDIISARYGTTKERLQNEMNLSYAVYNQMAQQLQMSKIKIQDTTPVYTVIEPPVTPLIPESPNKKIIVIGFLFLGFLVASAWIICKDFFFSNK